MTGTAYGTSTAGADDWRDKAACLDHEAELFFPIGNTGMAVRQVAQAIAVCASCRVKSECLRHAMDNNEDAGVWGGMPEDERRKLKRRDGRQRRARGDGSRGRYLPSEPTREIIQAAIQRGWNGAQVAREVGMTRAAISELLAGRWTRVTEATARSVEDAHLGAPPPGPSEPARSDHAPVRA